ncbi:MAG: hypothetical protein ABI601_08295 [bacterium]
MPHARSVSNPILTVVVAVVAAAGCTATTASVPADHLVPIGTWGGDSGGLIVGDTSAHLHIGCTFGDLSGRVVVSEDGRFDVEGSYMLRAYPILVGPTVPARFVGRISGSTLTIIATVDDTVEHRTVVRGPVSVTLGADPKLGPCPICRRPSSGMIKR